MGTILRTLVATLAWISTALAANGGSTEGNSFLVTLFLAFGALIIVFQLVPSLVLFGAMVKGLLTRSAKEPATVTAENTDKTP